MSQVGSGAERQIPKPWSQKEKWRQRLQRELAVLAFATANLVGCAPPSTSTVDVSPPPVVTPFPTEGVPTLAPDSTKPSPTPEPTNTPYSQDTPTPTPEPTSTPTPEPTATATKEVQVKLPKTLEEKWQALGFLPDYRETQQVETVSFTLDNYGAFLDYFRAHMREFDAIYGPELRNKLLTPAAAQREGFGWRVGFTQVVTDKDFAEMEREFGRGGVKQAGEIIMPAPEVEGAYEAIEKIGAAVHAINLGILDKEKYDEGWYKKYLAYIEEHPDASYELEGFVQKPGERGTYVLTSLGKVDATLPVELWVLPPVIEKDVVMKRVDRIIGGDPRAPFGMEYLESTNGYFSLSVKEGRLIVFVDYFLFGGKLLSSQSGHASSAVFDTLKSSAYSPDYRSPLTSAYGRRTDTVENLYISLFLDPYKGGWEHPRIVFRAP